MRLTNNSSVGVWPEKTAKQIENLNETLHIVTRLHEGANILELVEGKPSIFFPAPDLDDPSLVNNLLAHLEVNLFGRVKYKVCQYVGPRFFVFGSKQLDWIEETKGWDPSDQNSYISGNDAVEDSSRFINQMLVNIKEKYPDSP